MRKDSGEYYSAYQNDAQKEKGKLKIFLGMAAGVGKTYAMLEEAQKKAKEGVDVLVGIVNTHGRPETAKLIENLKVLPQKTITYKEKEFKELDIDAILNLKPDIVLIDELAHSNIPGSKHLKRWQDVVEILEEGIDVYSTLNVQHIESYKDIIEGITAIKIRETVPDLVLEMADQIICIDITPSELLQRLREGKVYTGDLSEIALQNFFKEDRLTALREIALRCTAEMVDLELSEMIKAIQKGKRWTPRERLLVAINHSPYSQQLIRTTRRLAATLHAPWAALWVDNGEALDEEETDILSKNLGLARELGAEVITTSDVDIAEGIQRIAEQKNITQIILGKSLRKKFLSFFKRSPVERLSKISSGIDVHVIRQSELYPHKRRRIKRDFTEQMLMYLHLLLWVGILSTISTFIVDYVGYQIVGSIFLLSILVLSLFFKWGHILLAAFLFALIWSFYFIPPPETFKIGSWEDFGFMILFILAALVTGVLANRVKKRQELLMKRERSTQAIYEIVREIGAASSPQDLFKKIKDKLGATLQGRCEIIPKLEEELNVDHYVSPILENDKEKAVAKWVLENGKEAGKSTFTLPSVKSLYLPLNGYKECVGVLVFRPFVERTLLPEESNFLHTAAQQLAHFLERTYAEKRERKNEMIQQIEQLYAQVLRSISDELAPPLKTIQSAVREIKAELSKDEKSIKSLTEIENTSDNLVAIAENASAMAKISSGVIHFSKSSHRIEELIDTCVKKNENALKTRVLKINVQNNLPFIMCDFALMTILIHHLLRNAIAYSPPMSTIEIEAEAFDGTFALSVSDEGQGIPEEMVELVFEKFYRISGTSSTGLGLGLAIVKSIAEIHNGWIQVQNRDEGGTKFSLILPL